MGSESYQEACGGVSSDNLNVVLNCVLTCVKKFGQILESRSEAFCGSLGIKFRVIQWEFVIILVDLCSVKSVD